MKKIIMALVLSLGFVVAVPASSFAASPITQVTGSVLAGKTPVSNASVTVTCGGTSESDTTGSDGGYLVTFPASTCPSGAVATASASKGGASGSNTGTAKSQSTRLNVALVDVNVALPEMGTVVGGIAALGGAGAFMVARKRQQDANRA